MSMYMHIIVRRHQQLMLQTPTTVTNRLVLPTSTRFQPQHSTGRRPDAVTSVFVCIFNSEADEAKDKKEGLRAMTRGRKQAGTSNSPDAGAVGRDAVRSRKGFGRVFMLAVRSR